MALADSESPGRSVPVGNDEIDSLLFDQLLQKLFDTKDSGRTDNFPDIEYAQAEPPILPA